MSTYVVAIGYVIADIDATKYILEYIATPKFQRNSKEIWLLLLLRTVTHLVLAPEAFRAIAYMLCFIIVLFDRLVIIMSTLLTRKDFYLYFRFYRQAILIWKLIYSSFQLLLKIALTVWFWLMVYVVWICVKSSPQLISTIVYAWMVLLLVCDIIVGVIGLPEICNMMELSMQAVKFHELRAKLFLCWKPSRYRRLIYMHARSIYPIRMSYGFFGWLGKDFIGEFIRVLSLRIFDTIILI